MTRPWPPGAVLGELHGVEHVGQGDRRGLRRVVGLHVRARGPEPDGRPAGRAGGRRPGARAGRRYRPRGAPFERPRRARRGHRALASHGRAAQGQTRSRRRARDGGRHDDDAGGRHVHARLPPLEQHHERDDPGRAGGRLRQRGATISAQAAGSSSRSSSPSSAASPRARPAAPSCSSRTTSGSRPSTTWSDRCRGRITRCRSVAAWCITPPRTATSGRRSSTSWPGWPGCACVTGGPAGPAAVRVRERAAGRGLREGPAQQATRSGPLVRPTIYRLTVYRLPIYNGGHGLRRSTALARDDGTRWRGADAGLARRVLLWSWVLIGVAAVVVFIALHVVPSAGAAGGCGGG